MTSKVVALVFVNQPLSQRVPNRFMGRIVCFKFHPDWKHGPPARIIYYFESRFRDLNQTWYKSYNDVIMWAEAYLVTSKNALLVFPSSLR